MVVLLLMLMLMLLLLLMMMLMLMLMLMLVPIPRAHFIPVLLQSEAVWDSFRARSGILVRT